MIREPQVTWRFSGGNLGEASYKLSRKIRELGYLVSSGKDIKSKEGRNGDGRRKGERKEGEKLQC